MHPLLAERYVTEAREYERFGSDCANLPGSDEQLTFALIEIAGQRDEATKMLRRVVAAYKKSTGGLRTADFHHGGCQCLRCEIDEVEALLRRSKHD